MRFVMVVYSVSYAKLFPTPKNRQHLSSRGSVADLQLILDGDEPELDFWGNCMIVCAKLLRPYDMGMRAF